MGRTLACLAAAVLVFTANAANARAPAGPGVAISELAGLDPAAVRARLAAVPGDWPIQPAFQIATPAGVLTFITAQNLMMDPALAQLMAVFRTHGDLTAPAPYLACREVLTRKDGAPEGASTTVLMFRDGRLAAVFQPIEPAQPPFPNVSDSKAMHAFLRRPRSSPFIAHLGELPLEDGAGFLERWPRTELASDDRLGAACAPPPPPRVVSKSQAHGLSASDMQGLALLPFAVTLPGKNQQRVAARQRGATLLATLQVGAPLGATPQAFAASHPGVRAYPAKAADYAVLSIDLGGDRGRNLTNFNDAALMGVRGGRIEWLSPPSVFGPFGDLLCLDDHGVPNTPRPGCSGWGHFSP